jgi:hypothetical protein
MFEAGHLGFMARLVSIEVYGYLFLGGVFLPIEAFKLKQQIEVIASLGYVSSVLKVKSIFLIFNAWTVISPFNFIKGGILPIVLIA